MGGRKGGLRNIFFFLPAAAVEGLPIVLQSKSVSATCGLACSSSRSDGGQSQFLGGEQGMQRRVHQ
jgi:hypothetical protein